MAELKTKQTRESVSEFIGALDAKRQADCRTLVKMMKDITGAKPMMWGPSIVGFGSYHYKYASGREGDWFLTGFSPRKQNLSIYLMCAVAGSAPLLKKLGKHKTGKSCLYVKTLADIDLPTLRELIRQSVAQIAKSDA